MYSRKLRVIKNAKLLSAAIEALVVLKEIQDLQENRNKKKNGSERKSKRKKRNWCVRPINRDRCTTGFFVVSFLKMKESNNEEFFEFTRMNLHIYNALLNILTPMLCKTSIREPISPECRLAVLLLHLSQGTPLLDVAFSFKLGKETVRTIVLETAEIVWKTLFPIYVSEPNMDDYSDIENDYSTLWNMPNCVGAIDAKHITVKRPSKSSNPAYNKDSSSTVLLAVCNAKYRFSFIDVFDFGSQSDLGILETSDFGKKLLKDGLPIPPQELPNTEITIPHYFVAGDEFPLAPHIMRPYSEKILPEDREKFNRRLSRAHRTIENTFGILVARWRILSTTLRMLPENAKKIILACVALHNFIMLHRESASSYAPELYTDWEDEDGTLHDGLWRKDVENNIPSISPSPNTHQYGGPSTAQMRNTLSNYLTQYS